MAGCGPSLGRSMKILVPLDGSELALSALAVAARFAREQLEVELLLLTVCGIVETTDDATSARDDLRRRLDEGAASVRGLPVRALVECGEDAATTIMRVAEDEAIDLIVMTTHGDSGLSPHAHGSVTAAVLQGTSTPVMLVRPSGEADEHPRPIDEALDNESSEGLPGTDSSATAPTGHAEPTQPVRTQSARTQSEPATEGAGFRLSLLGACVLSAGGEPVVLNRGTQRLLAFVALQGRAVSRDVVAEALWPEVHQERSLARLRSAIWRLERPARQAMSIDPLELNLSPDIALDLAEGQALARRLVHTDAPSTEEDMTPTASALLSSDLLQDWTEDWAIVEAEEWRQLRLHALEALAQKLLALGRYSDALERAAEAKKADPLRETPHALMIRTYLAEGNQSEAIRAFLAFRELLHEELGIPPTPQLRNLMKGLS